MSPDRTPSLLSLRFRHTAKSQTSWMDVGYRTPKLSVAWPVDYLARLRSAPTTYLKVKRSRWPCGGPNGILGSTGMPVFSAKLLQDLKVQYIDSSLPLTQQPFLGLSA